MELIRAVFAAALAISAGAGVAAAEDQPSSIAVVLRDHRFNPAEIHVPAGKRVILVVKNEDETPEEFNSSALMIEKVIAGGQQGTVRLHPLGKGRYPFMGEYHENTAKGVVIAE